MLFRPRPSGRRGSGRGCGRAARRRGGGDRRDSGAIGGHGGDRRDPHLDRLQGQLTEGNGNLLLADAEKPSDADN